jgi:prophage maintenance system killer protein
MNEPLEVEFLTLDDVLELHEEMITVIGGAYGVKDANLLDSALA